MQENGLKALIWRGFRVKTTDSDHLYGYAPNRLPGRTVDRVNQVWVTDITYIRIEGGFVYLACVMDLFTRKIVGHALSDRLESKLCIEALNHAIRSRKPLPGLIHHSDRGSQYCSHAYRKQLQQFGMQASMSRKGDCWDNAPIESFFKTLKVECIYQQSLKTREEAKLVIFDYIETFYNRQRKHSGLNYLSPMNYELAAVNS